MNAKPALVALAAVLVASSGVVQAQTADDLVASGEAKRKKSDERGAIADFTKAIELDPKNAKAWALRGRTRSFVWALKGRSDDDVRAGAMSDFARALDLDPKARDVYNDRATIRLTSNPADLDGAIADFTKMIEIDPSDSGTYISRAEARAQKGDLDGAIADAAASFERREKATAALRAGTISFRARLRLEKGDLKGAIADMDKAVELEPGAPRAWLECGRLKHRAGDRAGARQALDKAVELDAKSFRAVAERGYLSWDERRWDDSLADLRQSWKLSPGWWPPILLRIFLIRFEKGEKEAAAKDLREAISSGQLHSFDAKIAKYLLGDLTEEKLLSSVPDDAGLAHVVRSEAFFFIGSKKILDGDKPAARERLKKCIAEGDKESPEHLGAQAALEALGPGE